MRKLIYAPIIHSKVDMGSLAPAIQRVSYDYGIETDRLEQSISCYWDSVENYLNSIKIDKIYQDSLLADGELERIFVEELASKDSRNYQVLLNLIRRGAQLVKTEDKELVLEEYRYSQLYVQLYDTRDSIRKGVKYTSIQEQELKNLAQELEQLQSRKEYRLRKRDEYIAKRIDETLFEEEIGSLFLGMEHDVIPIIPKDVEVVQTKKRETMLKFFMIGVTQKEFKDLIDYIVSPIKLEN